jgi:hypothetical protein
LGGLTLLSVVGVGLAFAGLVQKKKSLFAVLGLVLTVSLFGLWVSLWLMFLVALLMFAGGSPLRL